ncbi:MAG TPA: protein kinase [Kofleriaceae bacterium]|jgi:serine/threonine-protein kinase
MKLCPKCQKQFSNDANFCPVDAARLVPLEGQTSGADSLAARFELGAQLGGSRTGAVYRATDKQSGGAAAVKVVSPAVTSLPGVAQRLERELKQLERVQSASVAKVLGSGRRGDETWVALEYLDGALTLQDAIGARGPIPAEQAAHLIEVIGEALIEAAQVGVVHRDLSPKNILIAGQDVKLVNFSLPVPTGDKVPGVAEFVAPEQRDGKPVDQRSNLYSLGALYYFVLTGQPVHTEGSVVKAPSSLAPVPPSVEAVILRALDKSPTRRFLTVRQFVDEVGRVARGGEAAAPAAKKPKAELVQTLQGMRETQIGIGAVSSGGKDSASASATIQTMAPVMSETPTLESAPIPQATVVVSPSVANDLEPVTAPVAAGIVPATLPGMPEPSVAPASQGLSPDRSPWAPPATVPPVSVPEATPPAPMPVAAAPAPAAPVIAAPVVAAPSLAATAPGKASSGKPSAKKKDESSKGKFRETMWFKKGELDAEAAEAAAEERERTGKDVAKDKADTLPIDERYKDDGSISRGDKEKYSLRTGGTAMMSAIEPNKVSQNLPKVGADDLVGEMKAGRNKYILLIGAGAIGLALLIFLLVR